MKKAFFIITVLIPVFMFTCFSSLFAEGPKSVQLPSPQLEGGKPLMQVLKDRQSAREFSAEKLPMQVLSNLLWAAGGINRPDSGKRTAPSARDCIWASSSR